MTLKKKQQQHMQQFHTYENSGTPTQHAHTDVPNADIRKSESIGFGFLETHANGQYEFQAS